MECNKCKLKCIKKGFNKTRQRWFCKACQHHFQEEYIYHMCSKEDEEMIVKLHNEGVGINGIGRLLRMCKSNVINKIKHIATQIIKPKIVEDQQEYEADEMYTFIKCKSEHCYVTYALNKRTKRVIDLVVGGRTKENLGKVINSLNRLNPKRIFTVTRLHLLIPNKILLYI